MKTTLLLITSMMVLPLGSNLLAEENAGSQQPASVTVTKPAESELKIPPISTEKRQELLAKYKPAPAHLDRIRKGINGYNPRTGVINSTVVAVKETPAMIGHYYLGGIQVYREITGATAWLRDAASVARYASPIFGVLPGVGPGLREAMSLPVIAVALSAEQSSRFENQLAVELTAQGVSEENIDKIIAAYLATAGEGDVTAGLRAIVAAALAAGLNASFVQDALNSALVAAGIDPAVAADSSAAIVNDASALLASPIESGDLGVTTEGQSLPGALGNQVSGAGGGGGDSGGEETTTDLDQSEVNTGVSQDDPTDVPPIGGSLESDPDPSGRAS